MTTEDFKACITAIALPIRVSLLGGFEQAANLRGKKSTRQQESLENGQLLSGCGLVQSIAHRRFLVIGG